MTPRNLRHLRVFIAVADTGSVTEGATLCNLSQPAVTQALGKLERETGAALFDRTRQGFFLTERGRLLVRRIRRAFNLLDPALSDISPRVRLTATTAQLRCLIAVTEVQNFTLAARNLGLAQPTVHRAITQLEQEASQSLFERARFGLIATRTCRSLVRAARLAFAELDQADADLAELDGQEVGSIVVGALPLSRSVILPRALIDFRNQRPRQPVKVIDGPYNDLLAGLRRGDIDVILGALRDPLPIEDVVQEWLFDDRLAILAGNHHPLAARRNLLPADLAHYMWVVPRTGTPSRTQFDRVFKVSENLAPQSILEIGSILLMREILNQSDHLGCISAQQAEAEIAHGLLTHLDVQADWTGRPIGLTFRANWEPTRAQALLLNLIRKIASDMAAL